MGCGCCGCDGGRDGGGRGGAKKGVGVLPIVGVLIASSGALVAIMGGLGQKDGKDGKPPAASAPAAKPAAATPTTPPTAAAPAPKSDKDAKSLYDFTMKRIDGKDESLSAYKDKVVLVVNVASECGLTKTQYPALQKLYTEKKDAGFVVLGFPANDFKGQEPKGNSEIQSFCTGTYGVTFPLFEKITVVGKDAHPLYKFIASQPQPIGQEPTWNFTKYLVGRDGKIVARFDPKTAGDDPAMVAKIDELLKAGGEKKDGAKKGG